VRGGCAAGKRCRRSWAGLEASVPVRLGSRRALMEGVAGARSVCGRQEMPAVLGRLEASVPVRPGSRRALMEGVAGARRVCGRQEMPAVLGRLGSQRSCSAGKPTGVDGGCCRCADGVRPARDAGGPWPAGSQRSCSAGSRRAGPGAVAGDRLRRSECRPGGRLKTTTSAGPGGESEASGPSDPEGRGARCALAMMACG